MNKDNSKKTIYDILPNKYKLIVNNIKLDYYIKMNNPDTQKKYSFRFDKFESILLSDSNDKKAYDKLLLFLLLENYKNEIEPQDMERCSQIIKKSK